MRAKVKKPDMYIGWEELREKVMQRREEMGYNSDGEERDRRERKVKGWNPEYRGGTQARGG